MELISFEQALNIVMSTGFRTGTEAISYTEALNRILAGDVKSDMDLPPFNKSSVDGFACRKADLGNELEILETIPAGIWPSKTVGRNQCSRIMTGAPVPEGADCVIMVEETEILPLGKISFKGFFKKENISREGEDVRKGEVILKAGKMIRPQDIAVMASVGHVSVTVSKMPNVAVISSGNELVEPDKIPGISQIRNSNANQLMAQVSRAGASGKYYGIAPDDEDFTFSLVEKAISENDMVLITGGVSMGDFDFVPSVLELAGVKILFTRVAVQPGKPTTFGLHPKSVIFGLPGNPVSSFVQFELLVRPLLLKMMGCESEPLSFSMPMNEKFTRRFVDRIAFIPVKITGDGLVSPVEYHGSAHISALSEADGIISMPAGKQIIEKGEIVSVRQI
ncbi:MAG: molybdopterin molybdotransferase MoeA [Bacteroidia bacterium]|nr:MAG: molybdopterin molybdotransferase MoeA [Bacteroidia bacterium]